MTTDDNRQFSNGRISRSAPNEPRNAQNVVNQNKPPEPRSLQVIYKCYNAVSIEAGQVEEFLLDPERSDGRVDFTTDQLLFRIVELLRSSRTIPPKIYGIGQTRYLYLLFEVFFEIFRCTIQN